MSGQKQPSPQQHRRQAVFVEGSIMRHIVAMTLTGSVGLMAIFLVDLIDMFFLSLLGQVALAAAIGYAGTLLFFTTSISIGVTIGVTALTARAFGQKDEALAARRSANGILFMLAVNILVVIGFLALLPTSLDLLGAQGEARALASSYLVILIPATPLLGLGMVMAGLLRAVGDAKRAMYVTLLGGLVNAVLDPIFIFGLDMGVEGAAWASVFARASMMLVGYWGGVKIHQIVDRAAFLSALAGWREDWRGLAAIALPAMATNVATPVGNSYVTSAISEFGDQAVAGWAIVGRIIPVAFAIVFSLSGAVGPIISQNLGAGRMDRVQRVVRDSLIFSTLYIFFIWLVLFLSTDFIISAFSATGLSASLIALFTAVIAGSFLFNGALFVSNAVFNNLGKANWSTLLNWGKATLGTIPPVLIGAAYFGAEGVLYGQAAGAVIFGILASLLCFAYVNRLKAEQCPADSPHYQNRANAPFSSGKAAMLDGTESFSDEDQ